ncbi:MAG: hypothetical protein AB6733_11315 [Clostridiaceae bacterium]
MCNGERGIDGNLNKLYKKYQVLREELCKLVEERENITSFLMPMLEAIYMNKIGREEFNKFILDVEIRTLKREINIRQINLSKGLRKTSKEIKAQVEKEISEWNEQLEDMLKKIYQAEEFIKKSKNASENLDDLRNSFIKLIDKLYPEINKELTDGEKIIWIRANEAYRNKDIKELEALSLLFENKNREIKDNKEKLIEELDDKVRELEDKIQTLLINLNTLNNKFPLNIKSQLENEQWVNSKLLQIRSKNEELAKQKGILTQFLKQLEEI